MRSSWEDTPGGVGGPVRRLQRVGHQIVDGRLVEDVRVVQIVRVEPAVRGDGAAPFGLVADQLQIAAERVAIHPPVILVELAVHSGQVVPRDQLRPLVDDMGDRLIVDGDGRHGKVGPIAFVLVPPFFGLHGVVDVPAVRQRASDRPVGAVAAGHGAVGQLEHERVRVRADGVGHPGLARRPWASTVGRRRRRGRRLRPVRPCGRIGRRPACPPPYGCSRSCPAP